MRPGQRFVWRWVGKGARLPVGTQCRFHNQRPKGNPMEIEKLQRLVLALHSQQMEDNARLITQQYLLEALYADRFSGNAPGFAAAMQRLISQAEQASTKSEPIADEEAMELTVRVVTRLKRFQHLAAQRISD